MSFTKLIDNKINLKNKQKFVGIIGSEPSKGARSPILWNKAFSKLKINMKMFPLDVKNQNVGKLISSLKQNNSNFQKIKPYNYRGIIKWITILKKLN